MRLPRDDNWARVELFRWQHGKLPNEEGMSEKRLHVPTALNAVADAIENAVENKDWSLMPAPMNMISIIEYAASLIGGSADAG